MTPGAVTDWCAAQGHLQVLWECGGVLAAPALADGAIHKLLAFVAPKLIGGTPRASSPVGDLGFYEMTQALTLCGTAWSPTGPDVLCTGYLPSPGGPLALDAGLDGGHRAARGARWPAGATSSSGGGDGAPASPPLPTPTPSTLTPPPPPIDFYKAWDAHGDLSNFSGHEVSLPRGPVRRSARGGTRGALVLPPGPPIPWPSVEHYYQAQKFAGVEVAAALMAAIEGAASPEEAARTGRAAARDTPHLVRPDWGDAKLAAMEAGLRAKYGAHSGAAAALVATGRARVREAAPSDFYWGIGVDGTGANHLGRLLEELRAELAAGGDVAEPLRVVEEEAGAAVGREARERHPH